MENNILALFQRRKKERKRVFKKKGRKRLFKKGIKNHRRKASHLIFVFGSVCIILLGYKLVWIDEDLSTKAGNDGKSIKGGEDIDDTKRIVLFDSCGSPVSSSNNEHIHIKENNTRLFCSQNHEDIVRQCTQKGKNFIKMKRGKFKTVPFSLSSASLHSLPTLKCDTIADILDSIKNGERKWSEEDENKFASKLLTLEELPEAKDIAYSLMKEQRPSLFVPSRCHVPFIPPNSDRACEILNKFSHVILDGDSLTRHLRQTLIMVLRGDWTNGAMMTNNTRTLSKCKCDGQYSEHPVCRINDPYFESTNVLYTIPKSNIQNQPSHDSVCQNLITKAEDPIVQFGRRTVGIASGYKMFPFPWDTINCDTPHYQGLFIMIQGGLHFQLNATETYRVQVEPILNHPKYQKCVEVEKVVLMYADMAAFSRSIDQKYPHQKRENALLFNDEMEHLIRSSGKPGSEDVLFLNWWNMTADSQSSDGVHSLMDVNLAKTAHLLYIMEKIEM